MAGNSPSASSVTTPDGRHLAYFEVGDPHGPLLLHQHGGPSSRLEAGLLATSAREHGLRLICVDRPGIGRSSPRKAPSYAGWSLDLIAVADALGYREFGVTGWSEGGPWALAAAASIDPQRLRHVSSIAGGSYGAFGDNWAADQLSRVDAMGGTLALRFTPAFRLLYWSIGVVAKRFPRTYLQQLSKTVSAYDQEILRRPEVASIFSAASAECFARGSRGLVRDSELLYRQWAFDVSSIERRVHLWQGLDDSLVAASINKTVADRLPGAVWHPVDGAGHFIMVGAADAILSVAAQELAA